VSSSRRGVEKKKQLPASILQFRPENRTVCERKEKTTKMDKKLRYPSAKKPTVGTSKEVEGKIKRDHNQRQSQTEEDPFALSPDEIQDNIRQEMEDDLLFALSPDEIQDNIRQEMEDDLLFALSPDEIQDNIRQEMEDDILFDDYF